MGYGKGERSEWDMDPLRYGPFGMLETLLKIIAIGAGFAGLAAFQDNNDGLHRYRVGQVVVIGINFAAAAFYVVQRFFCKEVFAFFFSILNVLGHMVVFLIMFKNSGQPGAYIFIFSILYFFSEIVKMFMFLFPPPRFDIEKNVLLEHTWLLVLIAGVQAILYFVCWVIQIVIWEQTFVET